MYFNTVGGSNIYMDNCASTTGSYSYDLILDREGKEPEYSRVIPLEFHGQRVYGRQINPERADIAMLNDNSEVYLDCFRTEGSGTALKCINDAKTIINLFNAGLGRKNAQNPLFDNVDGSLIIRGATPFGCDAWQEYNILVRHNINGETVDLKWDDYKTTPEDYIKYRKALKHSLTFDYKK